MTSRVVALLVVMLAMIGCTRAIDVPENQFDAAAESRGVAHRITLDDGSRYVVNRFSITDSTLTVRELNQADERYKKTDLPIVLDRNRVASIQKLELDQGKSFFIVAPVGLLVLAIILLSTGPGWYGSN